MTAAPSTALTIIDRVEKSPAVLMLDARAEALFDLLPDEAARTRFRRVVIQALIKSPDLLNCTPESITSAVFEAAAMGLEPTGAAGGAHLVKYGTTAQLIPDYRGIIRLVTKAPSDVVSIEARTVKEGDDFAYELGTDAWVRHTPSLAADRSVKPTTHVYAVARLRAGGSIPDVMDRAEVERIQKRGRSAAGGPWATDWDEMAKKTVIKRLAKVLPVRPEVRSLLTREDELDEPQPAPTAEVTGSRTARLAARLRPAETAQAPAAAEDGIFTSDPAEDPAPFGAGAVSLRDRLLDTYDGITDESLHQRGRLEAETDALNALFVGAGNPIAGLRLVFDRAPGDLTGAHAAAILGVAASMGPDAFRAAWRAELG